MARIKESTRSARWMRLGALAAAFAVASLVAASGSPADEQLRLLRDHVRATPASGDIVIVEIDARSLKQITNWPWPRRVHARLIDRLRAAGANQIAFDVDFSAPSSAHDDAALASALARAGGTVILPTFRQQSSSVTTDFDENLPISQFRDHAFLGSVNVQADSDGQLRLSSYGTQTAGVSRPSIAALLAESPGRIGSNFRVDTAIDPATIPRVSAIRVLNGDIRSGALNGKSVLVGATAIEMGDRYVVPGHGILPGVVVQVLAAETLLAGTMNPDFGAWPPLLCAFAITALIALRHARRWSAFGAAAAAVALVVTPLVLETARIGSVQIVPGLIFLALDAAIVALIHFKRRFTESRLTDPSTGLPNARALDRQCRLLPDITIVTASVLQFEEMDAILTDADRTSVVAQVIARIRLAFPDVVVHAAGPGTIALPLVGCVSDSIHDQIESTAALFRAPIALGHRSILVTPAFGISTGPGAGAIQVLAEARFAVRQAQNDGRRVVIHSIASANEADRALTLLADLERALADNEVHAVFQPKWGVAAQRIIGAEALVRWAHPVLGPISPEEFIPILETNGQMRALSLHVADLCFAQLHRWQGRDLSIAVNISATLLDDIDFVAAILEKLKAVGNAAGLVTFEVTESAAFGGTSSAIAALAQFRALGAKVSIDDYGTGHATLAYLKSFPADEIKIDKSFVTGMMTNNSDQIVVRSTIELAHELGFTVVAEGAEDLACLERLADFGCDTIQGWVIGKPVTADRLLTMVDAAMPLARVGSG
jgi:diguanylate cyclase